MKIRRHYWQYLVTDEGISIPDATIEVFENGSSNHMVIFDDYQGDEQSTIIVPTGTILTDPDGFFQFWVQTDTLFPYEITGYNYPIGYEGDIKWYKDGYGSGEIKYIDFTTSLPGPTGYQGIIGLNGLEGFKGPKGLTGPTGIDNGGIGQTGPTGPTGPSGIDGTLGATGATGPQGKQGVPGGPQGYQGIIGTTTAGPPGFQGPQGPQGDTGSPASPPPAGAQGLTGAQGNQGYPGKIGPTGSPSNTGIKAIAIQWQNTTHNEKKSFQLSSYLPASAVITGVVGQIVNEIGNDVDVDGGQLVLSKTGNTTIDVSIVCTESFNYMVRNSSNGLWFYVDLLVLYTY